MKMKLKKEPLNLFTTLFFFTTLFLFMNLLIVFSKTIITKKEGFTPKIKGIIRPHIRKARMFVEDMSKKHYNNSVYFFKKMLTMLNIY